MENLNKKDIHGADRKVKIYLERIRVSSMSEKQKKKIFRFVEDLRIGKAGKKVKSHRIISYLAFLLFLDKIFKQDLNEITEKRARQFYIDLLDNKIRMNNGLPYSASTKNLFVRTLKRYLGWCLGKETSKYKKIVGWMKLDKPKSEKRAIEFEQAKKIVEQEKSVRNRCLFMFLFDSGARIEEALNVRLQDLEVRKRANGKDEYYMVRIRVSKTKGRKIPIPMTTRMLSEWLKEHPTGKSEDFLFPINYDAARKIIRIMARRTLDHSLTPHELRHSSVTYYVQQFGLKDIAGFYYRYGWAFGSEEAKIYIDEHIIGGEKEQEKIVKVVESDRIDNLEKGMSGLEKKNKEIWRSFGLATEIINSMLRSLTGIDPKIQEDIIKQFDRAFPNKEWQGEISL